MVFTNLNGSNFRYANLQGVDLASTNVNNTDFTGANMRDINLSNADLTGSILTGANLSGAVYCNTLMPDGTVKVPYKGLCPKQPL